jgi:hypothetical protein
MVEMRDDRLIFSFPEVHKSATLTIEFQRTLRIPDDGGTYVLPPGLGRFPLRHVDDGTPKVPAPWMARGGVMLPMYQAEALWIRFEPGDDVQRGVPYPFAVAVGAGKINAVTGQQWTNRLHADPQDYVVAPPQPWLDGFCVTKGTVRQFVAMPLGRGYTAEEQITGEAEYGGMQIMVYPMLPECFERRFPIRERRRPAFHTGTVGMGYDTASLSVPLEAASAIPAMGLGAGGQMKQQLYDDPYGFDEWVHAARSRCFVHLANSEMWRECTGEAPPTRPPTAAAYTKAGLPWFDYYAEGPAVEGSPILRGLKSVFQLGQKKGETPIPDNEPVKAAKVVVIKAPRTSDEVRDGSF